jgi:FecR protein
MTHLPFHSSSAAERASLPVFPASRSLRPWRAPRTFRTSRSPALPALPAIGALGLLLALLATAATAQPQPAGPQGPQEPAYGYDTPEPQAPDQYGSDGYDPASAQPPAAAEEASQPVAGSYGYLRLVEGSATVTQASSGSTVAAGVNQPIMVGDRIMVPPRGRVEVVLADRNIVRIDGDTRLQFTRLANSADRQDPSTELRLDEGNLQLIVAQDSVGQQLPTVLTPNASTYIQAYGSYRITADRGDFTQVVVRRGTAELVADAGDSAVHAGEEATIDSQRQAGIDVRQAGGFDALERWARQLDDETRVAQSSYVDPSLGYDAAPLDRYGHWINSDGRDYWQPNNVDSGWSPYWDGYWDSTPSGQFWVSSEPWGWVPYHYGTWDYLPAYGWAWQPGYAFAPAWVYWYWGPSYVGWCPIGFYTGFYGNFFAGFRFGLYGWAGGGWGAFRHWNFCGINHFFGHDWHRWGFGGGRGFFPHDRLARGVITTDTRGITPALLRRDPGRAMNGLIQRQSVNGRVRGNLPDVTPFVQRQTHLPGTVAHAVSTNGTNGRLAGTPLQPRTLGAHQTAGVQGNLQGGRGGAGAGSFNGSLNGARGFRNGPAPAMPPGRAGSNGMAQGFSRGNQGGFTPGAQSGRARQPATSERGSNPSVQQHMGTFGTGRTYQGGTTQSYPSHPAPARPQDRVQRYQGGQGGGSNGGSTPSSPTGRYQVTPRYQTQTPRYNSAPQSPRYQNAPPRYQGSPGYQSPRSYQSAPRYQQGPSYQSAPRYQSPQRYQSTPQYRSAPQSTPQYRSSPQYQSAPRYQSPPRYQSAPRSQSAPHYSSPPRSSAPRSSAPSRPSGGGSRGNSGSRGGSDRRHTG